MGRNLTDLESAKLTVRMLEKDISIQIKFLLVYQDKLDMSKEELEIAKKHLADLERPPEYHTPTYIPNETPPESP